MTHNELHIGQKVYYAELRLYCKSPDSMSVTIEEAEVVSINADSYLQAVYIKPPVGIERWVPLESISLNFQELRNRVRKDVENTKKEYNDAFNSILSKLKA